MSYPPSYVQPVYENPYDGGLKFERERAGSGGGGGGYLDENSGRYGFGRAGLQSDLYEKGGPRYDRMGDRRDGLEEGVYAYDGGKAEPYGARGTGGFKSLSSSFSAFDDYGRSISLGKEQTGSAKIVRAVPKVEAQQDVKSGVQKFRVKLLPEGGGQSTMDVLCQVRWWRLLQSHLLLLFVCQINFLLIKSFANFPYSQVRIAYCLLVGLTAEVVDFKLLKKI